MYKLKNNGTLLSPVSKIFRIYLSPFQSGFTLKIPRHFISVLRDPYNIQYRSSAKRLFYFSELELTPSYFNVEEDVLQKMTGGKKEETEIELAFQLIYNVDPRCFKKEFVASSYNPQTHSNLVRAVNQFFDESAVGFIKALFYIDWFVTDEALEGADSMEDYIEVLHSVIYDEATDRYDNALVGHSMMSDYRLNKFIFPNNKTISSNADNLKDFRFRLFVAPKSTITFSNKDLLLYLGFTSRKIYKTFEMSQENENIMFYNYSDETIILVADAAPLPMLAGKIIKTKIKTNIVDTTLHSRTVHFTMPVSIFNTDSAQLAHKIGIELETLADENNMRLSIAYDATESLFKFTYPRSPFVTIVFSCSEFLSNRLGFGYITEISKDVVGKKLVDQTAVAVAKEVTVTERSEILCKDTGSVIVVLENVSSNKTDELQSTLMASMRPSGYGTMIKTYRDFHEYMADLMSYYLISDEEIVLKFKILRKNDKDIFDLLNWSTGCFISGCFEGIDANLFGIQN